METNTYKFFFQRYPVEGIVQETKDLEIDFPGCRYLLCKGLSDYGKIKNIVKEDYAEAEMPRVYIPEKITRETSTVQFSLYFAGANRRDVFDQFVDYITGHKLIYWDNCRNREVHLLLEDEIQVEDDILYGGNPYLICAIKFTNLKGSNTKKV